MDYAFAMVVTYELTVMLAGEFVPPGAKERYAVVMTLPLICFVLGVLGLVAWHEVVQHALRPVVFAATLRWFVWRKKKGPVAEGDRPFLFLETI